MNFSDLALDESLLTNLKEAGYLHPTPVQERAIPLLLQGNDLLGIAQTGTGKTAAFALPIIHLILNSTNKLGISQPRALILAPTRELCTQIKNSIDTFTHNLQIRATAIFGGVGQAVQVQSLKNGVDIVIATPGRLLDLHRQEFIRLSRVEMLVLDEADRMLDMGFREDIDAILKALPDERQTMLFSATMPKNVISLAQEILIHPERVEVATSGTSADNIDQKLISCAKVDKFQLLRKILKQEEPELAIVFTKTKDSADKVKEYLRAYRIAALLIHGDKDQADRERALHLFKNADVKILIATDIAARGIDIPGVSHVINFELPMEAESYVHRIGRTARAGRGGKAITFYDDTEKPVVERILKLIKRELPVDFYKGTPEPAGVWSLSGPMPKKVKAPTPGKSQEKTAYLDHSKRQKLVKDGEAKPRPHPGFKKKKKRK